MAESWGESEGLRTAEHITDIFLLVEVFHARTAEWIGTVGLMAERWLDHSQKDGLTTVNIGCVEMCVEATACSHYASAKAFTLETSRMSSKSYNTGWQPERLHLKPEPQAFDMRNRKHKRSIISTSLQKIVSRSPCTADYKPCIQRAFTRAAISCRGHDIPRTPNTGFSEKGTL